jgi:hypothetical protein
MKTPLLIIIFIGLYLNCNSQSVIRLNIRNVPTILCGDSVQLTADLTSEPVKLSLETLGQGSDDIRLKVVDKLTLKVHKDLNLHVSTKLDTILNLDKGEYYLLWINGGANLKNPELNCKRGLWTVTDSLLQLEFKVDTIVDTTKVIYKWEDSEFNSKSIKVAPHKTQYFSVTASTLNGYVLAKNSVKVNVYPYEQFINESKQWKYVQTLTLTKSSYTSYRITDGYFKGDTLLNNECYKKFYCKSYFPNSIDRDTTYNLSFLFKEDTSERKIFIQDLRYNTNALLYDFKLKVGDEFNAYVFNNYYSKKKVVSTEVFNKNHKKIIFHDSTTWIEGIGSITRGYIPAEGELICTTNKDSVLYLNSTYKDCNPVFVQDPWGIETSKSDNIEVFPNPVNACSIIRLLNSSEKQIVEIFNYQGKLIKSDIFHGQYPIGKLNLIKGFYILKIKTNYSISNNINIIVN